MASAASLAPWLLALLLPAASRAIPLAVPPPPPPPPPPPATTPATPAAPARLPGANRAPRPETGQQRQASSLRINGRTQTARWLWVGPSGDRPTQLWIPLEVLENQLGVTSRSRSDGSLDLEWFGQGLQVAASAQRSLDDEVAIEVSPMFRALGVAMRQDGNLLSLELAKPQLLQVRSSTPGNIRRVVLDLSGPAVLEGDAGGLRVDLTSRNEQQVQLQGLGLLGQQAAAGLSLKPAKGKLGRVFSLGDPARVVIEWPVEASGASASPAAPIDPRLQALLGKEVQWDRLIRQGVRINAVRIDPRTAPLQLRPLARPGGMEGLSSLVQLANQQQAWVAINGGYFNRVRRLPLGALKDNGRWLSGPILNRGVAAWGERSLPQFGRLQLSEWIVGPGGQRLPIVVVNSGYVQRGISRYTADWGSSYKALSGSETGLLIQAGSVRQRLGPAELDAGVLLRGDDLLLVARGGAELPWGPGERLQLESRPSNTLGLAPHVIGGGPLLLLDGRIVLNGAAENFSSSFLSQGAPRTVLASDDRQVWLITMEGTQDSGPSLGETAALLQQLGLRHALNLDGGSSTGLVLGGSLQVKGRGVAGSVHNGVGLVP
ncbi:phosphodiester glycosidase family protein [Cyanobium sp. Alchichica 3B3-8F6]|uniref:phosphodiester glycosidase family protein n=1 Tax=Cyanobium sp. Alchichica 3B3-8F6 TaxID=2823696 RepID=UPI0020CE8AB2|nr:phosphodiester glycosidase family protein [Cyanobium sp. Alchichica 3B3-8F6]MCP9882963.1 phosphodiester glycosidase family protein [Cyanobium sp. Alchichica 3B3-8F6]